MVLAGLLCLGGLTACTSHNDDINGYYRYEKVIFHNIASSHLPTAENTPDYLITDTSLIILEKDGTYKQITAGFEKSEVDVEEFNALFQFDIGVPDISGYKQRYQYIVDRQYRLYVMDDKIWIAECPMDIMWGIYQLAKVEGD